MWLWPPIIQRELDNLRHSANNRRMRKQKDKAFPSRTTPNFAYTFPESFGGQNCLRAVDVTVVDAILRDLEGTQRILVDWGVSGGFDARMSAILTELCLPLAQLDMANIWIMFAAILGSMTVGR